MSAEDGDDGGPGRREIAQRVFAAEYEDADLSYSESDEERAPNYVVLPTGARVNRLFAVGVLTEVESVNDDVLRGRVVDPTGAFVVYAGQYQPDAVAALDRADTPSFVAVTGKARTFRPEDSDRVYTSIRPESVNEVDADTRDRWTVRTAEHTLARVATFGAALDRPERGGELRAALEEGVEPALAAGIPRAIEHYGTTRAYLGAVRGLALDAARVVAGERGEVPPLELEPGEGGDTDVSLAFPGDDAAATADDTADGATGGGPPSSAVETAPATGDSDGSAGAATDPGETGATEADADPGWGADVEPDDASSGDAADTRDRAEASDGADGTADDGMYELDDAEREEIESEYGAEFATGDAIPEAGEADIETPDTEPEEGGGPERADATDADSEGDGAGSDASAPSETGTETERGEGGGDGTTPSGDELEDLVVEEMRALADGEGADRAALLSAVVEAHDVEEAAVEDAIQEALMSGRCYESGDDELTPI
jgi:RPA family protein